ncbi:FAD-dependent oxidoreductase [Patescibacteria group bacterium]|nr:FAD-dependent oxidoreductase [Patescibacteria group bacterium]
MKKARRSSFWGDLNTLHFPPLTESIKTKHLIIGGGISGLSAAYFLLENGETDIVILEQGSIGQGSTGHSAGMLICEPETASWSLFVARYGAAAAKKYWNSQIDALKLVSKIIGTEKIECDFMKQELLLLGNSQAQPHILKDFGSRKKMRSPSELLSGETLMHELATDAYTVAERVGGSISVNPLLFAKGFAKYLSTRGVRIYEKTPFIKKKLAIATTPQGEIQFKNLIRCMGTYEKKTDIKTFLTTISITRKLSKKELISLGLADKDMFFDDERRSYHYGKITGDNRLLVGYGDVRYVNTHGKPDYVHMPHVRNIERFLRRAFPAIALPLEYSWSARYALSNTTLPLASISQDEVTINGAGTQLASIATASYAVHKLLKKKHPLDNLFGAK